MIVFAQGTYDERVGQTLECIKRAGPYVDRVVIVVDDTVDDRHKELIEMAGPADCRAEIFYHPWTDNFPDMRNNYLSHCNYGDWVLVSDPDEWFDEVFLKDLRNIIQKAEELGYNLLLINVHDTMLKIDGSTDSSIPEFYKFLLFKYTEGVKYLGTGEAKNLHEELIIPNRNVTNLPKKYFYQHIKHEIEVLERSFRNVWISGGGADRGIQNPHWGPLHIITIKLGLKTWKEVRQYLRTGNVDPELRDWIMNCRTKAGWDYEEEMFQCWRYMNALHPNEFPDPKDKRRPSIGSPPEVEQFVNKTYLTTLGRYPDVQGRDNYVVQILNKRVKRETLPQILLSNESPWSSEETAVVRVTVDATIKVEAQAMMALAKDADTWNVVKPRLDLARAIEESVSMPREDIYQKFYQNRSKGLLAWLQEGLIIQVS